ncbi:endonuclease domain-containing protein [Brevundimonas vitis]|uniref:Endonuclease domain-containing protein n=2 Tax=Brevundimonas vitisensis TaxID=2800818 RepID=A0ABX7BTY5_9CAUL|nr:endonuclease domain-containing protein [Brevundimonas vitisensis]
MRAPVLTQKRAKSLRRTMTPPETALWSRLRQRQPGRPAFRRQHPIGPYILDFYCSDRRLAIEIDGIAHNDQSDRDARRDVWLRDQGIKVVRIPAVDVLRDPDAAAVFVWSLVSPQ